MPAQPIYQFYAELVDYKPKIWRRFQVLNNMTMAKLGYVLMTLFEMKASHLFCFDVPFDENFKRELTKKYSKKEILSLFGDTSLLSSRDKNWHIEVITEESYDYRDQDSEKLIEARETRVKSAVRYQEDQIIFSYDFGDGWQVRVVLEKVIIDKDLPGKELPRVLEGEGFGIVEDCGGPYGLENLAKAFKSKKGKQYKAYCDWLGCTDLDLLTFDLEDMNFRLKKLPRIFADAYEYDLEPTKRSMDLLNRAYKFKPYTKDFE